MDVFEDIGRMFATPQYWLTTILALIMIGFGIYMLARPAQTPTRENPHPMPETTQKLTGAGLVGGGLLFAFIARRWRNLVRTNPRYARMAGVLDILNFLK